MTSLSNAEKLMTQKRETDWEADIFAESFKMSTYLVAFVFSDYVGTTKNKVTVWSPPHRKNDTEFALDVANRVLDIYENKLRIPYVGSKLDMVPVTFQDAVAMENWGIIIYRENKLLIPKHESTGYISILEKAPIVAHEIAHQWFGNLVTPKWWSGLWLSEGITTFMEGFSTTELYPKWNKVDPTLVAFYSKDVPKLEYHGSPALWHSIDYCNNIIESYEMQNITNYYYKGAIITRMARQLLGEEVFWKGLKRYLKSNAYKNVEEKDLWQHLTEAQTPSSEMLNMTEIMYNWTHHIGLPIVTVHRDMNKDTLNISQELGLLDVKGHENYLWNIPIIIKTNFTEKLHNKTTWLKGKEMVIENVSKENDWIVVNGDRLGDCLIKYDRENWIRICAQLFHNHTIFGPSQRYNLLKEAMVLQSMGYYDIKYVFESLLYLPKEEDSRVFETSISFLTSYFSIFDDEEDDYFGLLREFIIYLWKEKYERVSWKKENISNPDANYHDPQAILSMTSTLCNLKYPSCVNEAISRYPTLKEGMTILPIPPEQYNEKYIVLCGVIENATYEEWMDVKRMHFKTTDNLYSLTFVLMCSSNHIVIRGELPKLLEVPDNTYWLHVALHIRITLVSFNEMIKFYHEHFEDMKRKNFVFDQKSFERLPKRLLSTSRIEQVIELLRKFHKVLRKEQLEGVEIFLNELEIRLEHSKVDTKSLKEWLAEKKWKRVK